MAKGKKKQAPAAAQAHSSTPAPAAITVESLYNSILESLKRSDPVPAERALQSSRGVELVHYDQHNGLDLLFVAVVHDAAALVELRLRLGKDPLNQISAEETTLPMTQTFQLHGRNTFEKDSRNFWTMSILHWAAMSGSVASMRQLAAAGADVNGRVLGSLQTPLHVLGLNLCNYSFTSKVLRVPASTRDHNVRFRLAESSYTEDEMQNLQIEVAKTAVALRLLGADIDALDALGRCPIASAIAAGQLHSASALLHTFPPRDRDSDKFVRLLEELVELEGATEAVCRPTARGIRVLTEAFQLHFRSPMLLPDPGPSDSMVQSAWNLVLNMKMAAVMRRAKQLGAERCIAWMCTWLNAEELMMEVPDIIRQTLVSVAVTYDEPKLLQAAQDLGLNLDVLLDTDLLPLYRACKENKLAALTQLCERAPAETLSRQLQQFDPAHGVTALGHAVAWGYLPETAALVKACKRVGLDINPLLTRRAKESLHHLPLFSAVIHGYPAIIKLLLPAGLDLKHSACVEHFESSSEKYVQQPSAASESMTLLMCAASLGSSTLVELLLEAGAPARAAPQGNKRFLNAIAMVLDHPDLDEQLRGSSPAGVSPHSSEVHDAAALWSRGSGPSDASANGSAAVENGGESSASGVDASTSGNDNLLDEEGPSSPVGWMSSWLYDDAGPRFQCLLLLLQHGASLTREQMDKLCVILDACAGDYEEGDALAKVVKKRVRACETCHAFGRWKQCLCKLCWYCSTACSTKTGSSTNRCAKRPGR